MLVVASVSVYCLSALCCFMNYDPNTTAFYTPLLTVRFSKRCCVMFSEKCPSSRALSTVPVFSVSCCQSMFMCKFSKESNKTVFLCERSSTCQSVVTAFDFTATGAKLFDIESWLQMCHKRKNSVINIFQAYHRLVFVQLLPVLPVCYASSGLLSLDHFQLIFVRLLPVM